MANTMGNIGALFGDAKTRNIIFITGLIMIGAVAVGVFGFKRTRPTGPEAQISVNQNLRDIQSTAGIVQATPAQTQLTSELNQQRYESETNKGGSFFPTIIDVGTEKPPQESDSDADNARASNDRNARNDRNVTFSPNGQEPAEKDSDDLQAQVDALKAQLAMNKQQQGQLAEQEAQARQQALMQKQDSMRQQAQAMMAAWNGLQGNPVQVYVARDDSGDRAKGDGNDETQGQSQENTGTSTSGGAGLEGQAVPPKPAVIKAGDILFAVLNTSVNSDEPGPVLATIVAGKYKGSKLIGAIQAPPSITGVKQSAVTLTFNTMNVPSLSNSTSISAVAIDPDTARTALASDVDKHHMQRYGTLFASSFLEGYGSAITQSGSITFQPTSGGTTTFQQELNPSEQFMAALGEVGSKWGQQMSDIFNRPYTITIDSGVSMGILFLDDVTNLGTE